MPDIELSQERRPMPSDSIPVFSQAFRPVDFVERFRDELKNVNAWVTVGVSAAAGAAFNGLSMIVLTIILAYFGFINRKKIAQFDKVPVWMIATAIVAVLLPTIPIRFLKYPMYLLAQGLALWIYYRGKYEESETNKMKLLRAIMANPDNKKEFLRQMNTSNPIISENNEQEKRLQWLNDLLAKLWPYLNGFIQKMLDKKGLSTKGIHAGNTTIFFERFSLGDRAPVVTHLSVNPLATRADELVIDFKLFYYGNCLVSVGKSPQSRLDLRVGVENIFFQANARLVLRPFLLSAPYIGGFCLSFLDTPLVEFHGLSLGLIGDNKLIKVGLTKVIGSLLVEPNRFYLLHTKKRNIRRRLVAPAPTAFCLFEVIEARDLPTMSILHLGHDPFCEIRVGGRYFKTKAVTKSANPIWNEKFWTPVHDLHDEFRITILERELFAPDDRLGWIEFNINDVISDRWRNGSDKWLPVSGSKEGWIHFRVACFKLNDGSKPGRPQQTTGPYPYGCLSIYVHRIRPLGEPSKEMLKVKPFLLIKVNKQADVVDRFTGQHKEKFNEHFIFRSDDPMVEHLDFYLLDHRQVSLRRAKDVNQGLAKESVLCYQSFRIGSILHSQPMILDDELKLTGRFNYGLRVHLQYFYCEPDEPVIANLKQTHKKFEVTGLKKT